jgi:hypothetical protein
MRVSCTTLESFRLWDQPDQEWMTEAELLATIRGEFVPTPAVRLGQAFGRVLERPERYRVPGGYRCGGYCFGADTIAPALALMDYAHGVFEAKGLRSYGAIDVVAMADQLVGADLIEHKTSANGFDPEKWEASYQWRYMVDIFAPLRVTYHGFRLDDHGNSVVELRDIETCQFYPYPGVHADCAALVERFAAYVEHRGLGEFLRARQRAA